MFLLYNYTHLCFLSLQNPSVELTVNVTPMLDVLITRVYAMKASVEMELTAWQSQVQICVQALYQ